MGVWRNLYGVATGLVILLSSQLSAQPAAAPQVAQPQARLLPEDSARTAADAHGQHWSFQPIRPPAAPRPVSAPHDATEIDRFIMAALERAEMALSPPAERAALLRRVTFDLLGLPPTYDEVQAFIQNDDPDSLAQVIDQLIDSPRYGERWGRHWLDIARYADTHGGGATSVTRFAYSYTYRDYVVDAFNRDLPFDRFIVEQLAADQLELGDNRRPLAALGFLTVGRQFRNPHDKIDDCIDVTTRGLMGLTVACARCHDHKYEAIPTADYYSLYAVFAPDQEPEDLPLLDDPDDSEAYRVYAEELARLKRERIEFLRTQAEVLRCRLRMQVGMYLRALAEGTPEFDLTNIFLSYRTEDLRPPVLERWRSYLAERVPPDDSVFGAWFRLAALPENEFSQRSGEVVVALQKENDAYVRRVKSGRPNSVTVLPWNPRVLGVLSRRSLQSQSDVALAYGEVFAAAAGQELQPRIASALASALGAVYPDLQTLASHADVHAWASDLAVRELQRHLYNSATPTAMSDEMAGQVLNRPIRDKVAGMKRAIASLHETSPGSPPRGKIVQEDPVAAQQRAQHVFLRGSPIARGPQVPPRFLRLLAGKDRRDYKPTNRRLQLARSTVDPANPLTSRVIANWVWQHHFGAGLVRTPDDFGVRGEPPTHPKLLDYLASTLVADGWSIKQLHRRIMLSRVYQQAMTVNDVYRGIDPDNRLLWRMPRRRLELEAMRDAMLKVAGRLDTTMGGRPFDLFARPFIPRRSLYGFVNRDVVAGLFSTFDMADPNVCTARRPETTVPQQALFALNSEFVAEQATALAERALESAPTDQPARVRALYRCAYARDPDPEELALAIDYVTSGARKSDRAAWNQLAHVLLASNEFMFLD